MITEEIIKEAKDMEWREIVVREIKDSRGVVVGITRTNKPISYLKDK